MSFHCSREVFPCRAACKIWTGSRTARSTTWPLKSVPGVRSPPPQSAVLRFRAASRLSSDVTFDLFLWLLLKGGKHAIPCCRTEAADEVFYNACSIAAGLRGAILPERLLHVWRFLNFRDALIFTVSVKAKSHQFIQTIRYFDFRPPYLLSSLTGGGVWLVWCLSGRRRLNFPDKETKALWRYLHGDEDEIGGHKLDDSGAPHCFRNHCRKIKRSVC